MTSLKRVVAAFSPRWILLLSVYILLLTLAAAAQNPKPASSSDEQFTFMKLLSEHHLHDLDHENWNLYGQFTYISHWKPPFPAKYTNLNGSINSLLPRSERSFTGTMTVYLGVRLWKGAEAYLAPEVISQVPFSQLKGLGGAI